MRRVGFFQHPCMKHTRLPTGAASALSRPPLFHVLKARLASECPARAPRDAADTALKDGPTMNAEVLTKR
jgi:hypothetical protein